MPKSKRSFCTEHKRYEQFRCKEVNCYDRWQRSLVYCCDVSGSQFAMCKAVKLCPHCTFETHLRFCVALQLETLVWPLWNNLSILLWGFSNICLDFVPLVGCLRSSSCTTFPWWCRPILHFDIVFKCLFVCFLLFCVSMLKQQGKNWVWCSSSSAGVGSSPAPTLANRSLAEARPPVVPAPVQAGSANSQLVPF